MALLARHIPPPASAGASMKATTFIFDRKRAVIYLIFLAVISFFVLSSDSLTQEYKWIFLAVGAGGFFYDLRSSWAVLKAQNDTLTIHISTATYTYKLSFIEEVSVHADLSFLKEKHPSWTEERLQRKGFSTLKDERDGRTIWFAVDRYPVADIRAGNHRFILSVSPELARILDGLDGRWNRVD